METKCRSPFKFLDSYSKEDRNVFFGRDEEIEELHFRIFKSKILVLFGVSGVGKTSLIRCGLANKFDEKDWFPVHIRRGENICVSLCRELGKAAVTEIVDNKEYQISDIIESLYLDHFKPIYLIFDQFEEVFIFGSKTERSEFLSAVKQVFSSKSQCRIIFSIREEYLGKLTEFEDEITDFLSNRIRINSMTRHNARDVIERSCLSHNINLEKGCSDAILNELFPDETEIDLAYLQIFLDQIYQLSCREQNEADNIRFSIELIQKVGSVKDILGSFLEEEISKLSNQDLAIDLLKTFVSGKGTKQQVTEEEILDDIKSPLKEIDVIEVRNLLRQFINIRIIRDKDENGRYELRHDSLASKINEKITLPEKELKEMRKFIRNSLEKFTRSGILLNDDDLKYIEPYLKKLFLNPEEKEFLQKSRILIGKRKQRTRNIIIAMVSVFVICLSGFTIWALLERTEANKAATIARSNETASFSILNLDKDPSLSFRLAEKAFQTYKSILAMEALSLAYETSAFNPFYNELKGHHSDIYCMDYTAHGDNIVTGSFDSTAKVWDLNGKELLNLKAHEGRIFSAKFSSDGSFILTASEDSTVRIWNRKGIVIAILRDPEQKNYLADFSPNGKFIITASVSGIATIWTFSSADGRYQKLYTLSGHEGPINSIHFSKDNNLFATTSRDQTARIWDYSGRNVAVLKGHGRAVRDLCFSPDNHSVVTASDDATARIWDLKGNPVKILKGHTGEITRCDYTDDGRYIVSTSDDHTVVIWDRDGNEVNTIRPNIGSINRLSISSDSRYFAIGADNGISQVYSIDGNLLFGLNRHFSSIREIRFAGSDNAVITASADGTAKIWKLGNEDQVVYESPITRTLCSMFSKDDQKLIVIDRNESLALIDLLKNKQQDFQYKSTGIAASSSTDQKYILTSSYDNTARLWDKTGKELLQLVHPLSVKSVEFCPDEKYILTSCNDGAARIWGKDGKMIREFKKDNDLLNFASYSPDGSRIITGSTNFSVTIWNTGDGSIIKPLTGHHAEITRARYAPDGSYILTASKDGTAIIWDKEGNLVKMFENSHRTAIEDIGFSANSNCFFTLSKKPYCIQIRNRNGDLMNIINLGDAAGREHFTQFSEDGKLLIVITNISNRVYLKKWPLNPEDLITNVNQRKIFGTVRQLSESEMKEFYLDR